MATHGTNPYGPALSLHDALPCYGPAVPVALVGEGADVAHVRRREVRRQFDHHAAAGQIELERAGRIERAPVRWLRGVQQLLRGLRLRCFIGGAGARRGTENGRGLGRERGGWYG